MAALFDAHQTSLVMLRRKDGEIVSRSLATLRLPTDYGSLCERQYVRAEVQGILPPG
jgi:hypothetical protein